MTLTALEMYQGNYDLITKGLPELGTPVGGQTGAYRCMCVRRGGETPGVTANRIS